MASVMVSDGETEEDVSADLTSVLSEEKVRPKNPSSRRKEVVDAKERSSIRDLNNFLSNFNDQINAAKSAGRAVLSSRLVCFFVSLSGKGSFHAVPDFRKLCIEVTPASNTAFLSEELCIGCVRFSDVKSQKSPFQAIQIINLPKDLEKDTIHCYNSNGFKLHSAKTGKSPRILLIGMKFGSLPWIRETKGMVESRSQLGTLGMVLEKLEERGMMSEICDAMDLNHLLDREATQVSGGELQPYGVVTLPFSVREGINVFLAGFVPTENFRFRDESLTFKVSDKTQESEGKVKSYARYKYPNMSKKLGNFKLDVMEGEFTASQIIVMLGENGTGKTIFIRTLVTSGQGSTS
ncbi:hypothetical protein Bca4012_077051 [Brassica carinata]